LAKEKKSLLVNTATMTSGGLLFSKTVGTLLSKAGHRQGIASKLLTTGGVVFHNLMTQQNSTVYSDLASSSDYINSMVSEAAKDNHIYFVEADPMRTSPIANTISDWFTATASKSSSKSKEDDNPIIVNYFSKAALQNHIVLLIILLFITAFVIAAAVEECMKHFTVRCCRFPLPLKDPNSILVYLLAGSLGFAAAENILYVFNVDSSLLQDTPLFVTELLVVFLRLAMPIHAICAVLQAVNLSKFAMGLSDMGLFHVRSIPYSQPHHQLLHPSFIIPLDTSTSYCFAWKL
jgi:hypothetical protein